MKAALSITFILLLSCQVFYLPARLFQLESSRGQLAVDYCMNRDQPELMCKGSCVLSAMAEEAMGHSPADGLPAQASQEKPPIFLDFYQQLATLPGLLATRLPAAAFHYTLTYCLALPQGIFRPPR